MTVGSARRPAGHLGSAWRLFWRAQPRVAVGLLVAALLAGVVPVALTWLTKLLVDGLTAPEPSLTPVVVGLAVAGVAAAALPGVTGLLQQTAGRAMDLALQTDLYGAVSRLDGLRRLEDPEFRNRLDTASRCTGVTLSPITTDLFTLGAEVITIVGLAGALWTLSPVMSVVVLVTTFPAVLTEIHYGRRQVTLTGDLSALVRRAFFYSTLLVDLQAAKEARLLGLAGFLRGRLRRSTLVAQSEEHRLDVRTTLTQVCMRVLAAAVAAGGLVWCVTRAVSGRFTAGDVVAFTAAVAGVQSAVSGLIVHVARAVQAVGMFAHFRDVLAMPNDLDVADNPIALPVLRRGIEFRDVWFRYGPDRPWVLQGASFTIPHGTTVGLVGLNGAGKSTLIALLCRFYDPQRGAVLWDGVDLRDVDVRRLRERIGAVFQDFVAYDLTAAENIGLGDVARIDDRAGVTEAARRADADRMLAALPGGYDTMLSRLFDDGDAPGATTTLSGGQWQRMAIARALFRADRDLLILDEPGSGLDPEAEHRMSDRLLADRGQRTNLLVSHRLGVLRRSDLIVVLDDGRVTERGSHDELWSTGGEYARLFRLQARGYATA